MTIVDLKSVKTYLVRKPVARAKTRVRSPGPGLTRKVMNVSECLHTVSVKHDCSERQYLDYATVKAAY